MSTDLAVELEKIIDQGLEDVALPIVKGNSIRIKHMIVRENKEGFVVYNSRSNKQVAFLFSKTAAIALAKTLANNLNATDYIISLDKEIAKNYNDCLFLKNAIRNIEDSFTRQNKLTRLDIALARTERAKESLDKFIFD